jgi:hypothetical protein
MHWRLKMRVSVDQDDPAYCGPKPHMMVMLNGVEVRDVITADEEQGFVFRHCRDESGGLVIDLAAGETVKETLRGVVKIVPRQCVSLTSKEKAALDHLAQAWNEWIDLPGKSKSDDVEFMDSIHRAQAMIAMRVARRADPDVWHQP